MFLKNKSSKYGLMLLSSISITICVLYIYCRNYIFTQAQNQNKPGLDAYIILALLFISLAVLLTTVFFGVSEEKRRDFSLKDTQKEILFRAEHDFLTKLPNRHSARVLLSKLISAKKEFAVLLLDIDGFKNFNDFYTHACGDAILRTISNRLSNLMIEPEIFASRFGGDEFLIIWKAGNLSEDSAFIGRIKSVFETPVLFEKKSFTVNSSIGITNSTPEITSADDIISNADIALFEAKKQGNSTCLFYNEDMKKTKQDSNDIKRLLEDACENDGFDVLYQPQINVQSGEIYGYEALVRLKNTDLSPSVFIPIAEECGLISKIDRTVTRKVIEQLAIWREHGVALKRVSINYSYAQISDEDYPSYIRELLEQYRVDSSLIGIEITESLFIKNKSQAKEVFDEFASIGVTLSLDDFGTGYSSLSYLTYLPVETVKIDKSLIDNYLSGKNDSFIKNIAHLIHSLDMKLTVEGVEYHWQFEKLKGFNCDYIQGYFFSKPITADEVETWSVTSTK
ncbi:MAG: EAL domain-containing protein [Treponema sp.]|nr:EAL domain-containing protein [Treponema sp.]